MFYSTLKVEIGGGIADAIERLDLLFRRFVLFKPSPVCPTVALGAGGALYVAASSSPGDGRSIFGPPKIFYQ